MQSGRYVIGVEEPAVAGRSDSRVVVAEDICLLVLHRDHHRRRARRCHRFSAQFVRSGVVPLVELRLDIPETVFRQHPVDIVGVSAGLHDIIVAVPREEVYRRAALMYVLEEALEEIEKILAPRRDSAGPLTETVGGRVLEDSVEAAGRVAPDLYLISEALLQVLRGDVVELVILLRRAGPHLVFVSRRLVSVRLVPDLPVLYAVFEAVCPAFIVVPYDVLTDPRPLVVVGRRVDPVRAYLLIIFDRDAETVDRLRAPPPSSAL